MTTNSPKSVYPAPAESEEIQEAIIAIIVDNDPGTLSRVTALFSARGYNIESLTVAETDVERNRSRITIVTSGTQSKIDQIKSQLGRLVPVRKVIDISSEPDAVERELALLKVVANDDQHLEIMGLAEKFQASFIDKTDASFVLELTGERSKVNTFIELLMPLGLVQVSRTGVLSIRRGVREE